MSSDALSTLRAENESLRAHIEYLETLLAPAAWTPPGEWGLTATESKMFMALLGGRLVSKEMLLSRLYFDRADDAPEIKIVDVYICKLRRKLRPFGVAILTEWGAGYRLDVDSLPAAVRGDMAA